MIERVESVIDGYSRREILESDQRSKFEVSPTWTILSVVCKTRSLLCGVFGRRVSLGVESRASCEGPRMRVLSESEGTSLKAHLIHLWGTFLFKSTTCHANRRCCFA